MHTLWIGTFPAAGAGTTAGLGEGIWRASLLGSGTVEGLRRVATSRAPTFLARHPNGRWLYAVGEELDGTVTAFEIDDGELRPRATISSGGADPCHLALAPDARTLYVANYSSGTLGVIPLDDDGALLGTGPAQVLGAEGTGPDLSRQEGPHAHFVAVRPRSDDARSDDARSDGGLSDGGAPGDEVVVADLGIDALRHYAVRPDGVLEATGLTALPPGTGPRHLAFSADGRHCYVVGELDLTVHVLERSTEGLVPRQVVSLAGGTRRGEHGWFQDGRRVLASHVELSGGRLLVGVREENRLEELAVADDGTLTPVATHPLGGWPRHFAVVGDLVLVAGQTNHALEILGPDGGRGSVGLTGPACVVVGV